MIPTLHPQTPLVLSLGEQLLLVGTAYILKPAYMLASSALLVRFSNSNLREIRLAWLALASFLIGETACAANYLVYGGEAPLVQLAHDLGMVGCFALLVMAALHALERTVLRSDDPGRPCALLRLCRSCVKQRPVRCMLLTGRLWLTAVLLVAALLPLSIKLRPVRYETVVFGRDVILEHGLADQLIEARAFPLVALLFLGASLVLQKRARPGGRDGTAKCLLALGLGFASFSWMRVGTAFPLLDRVVWMGFWEEASEMALVVLAGKWMLGWTRRLESRLDSGS